MVGEPLAEGTLPDLVKLVQKDPKGKPPDKYAVLTDAFEWATNVGYPGYANAAIDDGYSTWALNTMFAQAATGAMSPEDAIKEVRTSIPEAPANQKQGLENMVKRLESKEDING